MNRSSHLPRGRRGDDRQVEALPRHGFGVAYRVLGGVSEAEDVARETLLRPTGQQDRSVRRQRRG
jgi:DNA-directed RNA polymerase specialized sigma24 family protein